MTPPIDEKSVPGTQLPGTQSPRTGRWWLCGAILAAAAAWLVSNSALHQFRLPNELLSVDMYSPPELQQRYAETAPVVLWKSCIMNLTLVGLSLGFVSSLLMSVAHRQRRLALLVTGVVGGLTFGFLAGQVGWTLRPVMSGEAMAARISDPIVRDTLFYAVVSLVLGGALASVYFVSRAKDAGQKSFAVLAACALAGAIVPIAAAPFPKMLTHLFPPEGLGLSAIWFGFLGALAGAIPMVIGGGKATPGDPRLTEVKSTGGSGEPEK